MAVVQQSPPSSVAPPSSLPSPVSAGAARLPRLESLPPPPELEELDDGWGGDEGEPSIGPPKAPRLPTIPGSAAPTVSRIEALAEALQASTARVLELENLLEERSAELASVHRELEERATAVTSANRKLEALRGTLESAEAEVRRLNARVAASSVEIGALHAAHRNLLAELDAARARAAEAPAQDDLQELRGIGPKLCAKLREVGITRFADLAVLDAAGVAALAARLGIPAGRIERDGWVEAASARTKSTRG